MTDTPLSEHIATIRATIKPYGKDDWFQGCSRGGGIYMRDLLPVLDAAERSPLSDDVVERCVKAMALREWPSDDPKDPIRWPDDFSERERETYHILARAALEAARYGEMVEGLKLIADNNSWRGFSPMPQVERMRETARALLSSIGASHE